MSKSNVKGSPVKPSSEEASDSHPELSFDAAAESSLSLSESLGAMSDSPLSVKGGSCGGGDVGSGTAMAATAAIF